jgi:hypothetical protein
MSPIIGEKPWFAPRRFGWGLEPVSTEGWAVTVVLVAASLASRKGVREARPVVAALALLTLLKGTRPGGPKARREFERERG